MTPPILKVAGLTLTELIITVALAGIVIGLGVPSFTDTIRSNRSAAMSNEFITALAYARSEAIKRGLPVTLRRSSSTASLWENGFDVFVDRDGDGLFEDDGNATPCETNNQLLTEDCLLKTYDAQTFAGFTVRSGDNFSCWVSFNNTGSASSSGTSCTGTGLANDSFRLCPDSGDASKAKRIAINNTGRTRITDGASSCP
ncbi:MAG: GspH/FimT family pseudopilin [Methylococcales bacterium]|nr:GspH/FimT family pseudopilin [Methylococcales bacterium]